MRYKSLDISEIDEFFFLCKPSRGGNIGLFVKNRKALIIDSGYYPKTASDILSFIRESLTAEPVLLFNTHYHSDHTFGNQAFDCPILSSKACADRMRRGPASFWSPEEINKAKAEDTILAGEWRDLRITFPAEIFESEFEYSLEDEKVVFRKLGGHTPGSAVALFPRHDIIFTGDLLFIGVYPTLLRDGDPFELIEALQDLKAMHAKKYVPGHGYLCDDSAIDSLANYWQCLTAAIGKAVDSGQDDNSIIDETSNKCRLDGIEYDDFRHKRNIKSILAFLRK